MASTANRIVACVIGAGSWGTALAHHLAGAGHEVRLWAYEPAVAQAINQGHENTVFMPGVPLNPALTAHASLEQALVGAGLVVLVMPSHVFRAVLSQAAPHLPSQALVVSCAKGIEQDTSYTMCEVAEEVLDKSFHRRLCCLSGPSFAKEVARGVPTAVTVASRAAEAAQGVQLAFATDVFRVYTSPDLTGVELGGAVKNPLAIAAGMVAGLKLGHNTLAALITRGLAEMTRLAMARGGQLATLSGLAGLGDLVLTCTSPQSRNYGVGVRLAQGETIAQITGSMANVAEGVRNTRTVLSLASQAQVEMPIIQAVHQVIYQGQHPRQALHELMTRDLKAEHA
ncbi:MAG: NAD(P)-dependent glycerol-3-phosphate dehydrogenase [Desulfarculus sp.]|nr:NAD(P)-dependent glycerol-3-phosphate dehydrogenase [Desulfarculus sp.]